MEKVRCLAGWYACYADSSLSIHSGLSFDLIFRYASHNGFGMLLGHGQLSSLLICQNKYALTSRHLFYQLLLQGLQVRMGIHSFVQRHSARVMPARPCSNSSSRKCSTQPRARSRRWSASSTPCRWQKRWRSWPASATRWPAACCCSMHGQWSGRRFGSHARLTALCVPNTEGQCMISQIRNFHY